VRARTLAAAALLALAGCTMGPDYRRPEYPAPPAFRGADPATRADAKSIGDLEWWTLFQDETLQRLIETALEANYDLRIAVARVLQARAQLVATRSFQFPTIDAGAQASYQRLVGSLPPALEATKELFEPNAGVDVSFEIDLWGRLRRATESARAQLLASADARRTVVTTLVSDVATAYFRLRELDLELEIARRTLGSREAALRLLRIRLEGGVATLLDVRQGEDLLYTAAETIPDLERQIEQTENLISTLLGGNPGPVPRGRTLLQQLALPVVPPGLPSALLERRPDIRQAEQDLVAANAQIGAAKALFFPQIVLLGSAAGGGALINGTFSGPIGFFEIGPSVTMPLFNMGRTQAGVDLAEAQTREALSRYQQTIQQAFREVADTLVEHRKRQAFRVQQELLTEANRDAVRLSNVRYRGGVSTYLEVLDSESRLFTAELTLARAQLGERLAIVQLYRALGGGWEPEGVLPPIPTAVQ
jgi:outer membrane protein, multidrug efflux system